MWRYMQDTRRTPTKVRWVRVFASTSTAFFLVALLMLFTRSNVWLVVCPLAISCSCFVVFSEIMYHGSMFTLALLLAPLALALYGIQRDDAVWLKWQFWVLTSVCEVVGGYLLIWINRIHRASARS